MNPAGWFAPTLGIRENASILSLQPPCTMRTPRLILDIALLQHGPQALPFSTGLTVAALASYAAAGMLAHQLIAPAMNPVGPGFFDLSLLVGFVLALLYGRGLPGRARQTLAALGGVGTLLTLCSLPVVPLLDPATAGPAQASAGAIFWMALMIWSLVVTGHVLRHALDISLPVGIFLALAYMMVSLVLYGIMFGMAR